LSDNLRAVFADLMLEVAQHDPNLIVIVGDISHGILQPFAEKFPDKYYNIGILEAAMVGIAAGLNHTGYNPVVHTIAPFLIERAFEQIKLDFGYQKKSVNLVSVGGSFDYSQLGVSHHSYYDVSMISQLEGSRVFLPGSAEELRVLFRGNYQKPGIKYFRLTENPHGQAIDLSGLSDGSAIRTNVGSELTLVTAGPLLGRCHEVVAQLAKEFSIEVLYYPTFKPFDEISVQRSVRKTGRFLVVEELSGQGGLFSQVAEALVNEPLVLGKKLAVGDMVHGYGSYDDLLFEAGLSVTHIEQAVRDLIDE